MNHMRQVVSLKWPVLNEAMAQALDTFFAGLGGDQPFLYTIGGVQRQWTCEEFKWTRGAPHSYSATIREDFNLS
jgi:hypothetical protein